MGWCRELGGREGGGRVKLGRDVACPIEGTTSSFTAVTGAEGAGKFPVGGGCWGSPTPKIEGGGGREDPGHFTTFSNLVPDFLLSFPACRPTRKGKAGAQMRQ